MQISTNDWKNYIDRLAKLNQKAASEMQKYVAANGFADTDALIDFCYALVTKYGEGSAELACQMYDAMAEMANAAVDAAVPAATATYAETARAVQGSLLQSPTGLKLPQIADRLVKQAAADTTLQNAIRDHAQWAWVPSGDTCGFCITLASNGWQRASKRVLRGTHATHIHANCDCMFAIRFSENDNVKGYDPDYYKKLYDEAPGGSSSEKVKALRRQLEDRDKINAQKRAAYRAKKINSATNELYSLGRNHVNRNDDLFINTQNVKSIDGFDDFVIHGDAEKGKVVYETTNGQSIYFTAKEYANIIKNDPNYNGDKVRLLSCGMGNEKVGFAQELANELQKKVMAPTETLWVAENGEMFVSDNDKLADMWYNGGQINSDIIQTGRWKTYKPQKR